MTKFRHLLSFPGGGVRGSVSATYVRRLVEGGDLDLNNVYSFSGASTGAIIAAALAVGMTPLRLTEIYQEMSGEVFKARLAPNWLARFLLSAPYSTDRLLGVLKNHFGDKKLADAKRLVIATWNLDGKYIDRDAASPLILHSHETAIPFDRELQENLPLYLAVGGSCAAPTYFSPVYFKSKSKSIYLADGGLVCNLSALANLFVCISEKYDGQANLGEMVSLVLGNGSRFYFQKEPSGGWQTPKMLNMLIGSIVSANQIAAHQLMTALLRERFLNFDPVLPFDCELDCVTKIKDLIAFAHSVDLAPVQSWLRGFFV